MKDVRGSSFKYILQCLEKPLRNFFKSRGKARMWYIKYSTKTTKGRNRIGDKNKNEKKYGKKHQKYNR